MQLLSVLPNYLSSVIKNGLINMHAKSSIIFYVNYALHRNLTVQKKRMMTANIPFS